LSDDDWGRACSSADALQRLGLARGCAALILVAWGVVAVKHFRLVWPYPRVLPGAVSFQRPRGMNGYLLVPSGVCFVMYETAAGG
jgi:hypothetical protein